MSIRHATALALLGWYLMLPPPNHDNPQYADLAAPMSQWTQLSAFGTADDCEANKVKLHGKFLSQGDKQRANYSLNADCIESNDPRLAK